MNRSCRDFEQRCAVSRSGCLRQFSLRAIHVRALKSEISSARTVLIASNTRAGGAAILIVWRSLNCHAGTNSSRRVAVVLILDSRAGSDSPTPTRIAPMPAITNARDREST